MYREKDVIPSSPILLRPGSRLPTPVDLTPAYEAWLLQRLHAEAREMEVEMGRMGLRTTPEYRKLIEQLVEAERTLPVTGWIVEKVDGR